MAATRLHVTALIPEIGSEIRDVQDRLTMCDYCFDFLFQHSRFSFLIVFNPLGSFKYKVMIPDCIVLMVKGVTPV